MLHLVNTRHIFWCLELERLRDAEDELQELPRELRQQLLDITKYMLVQAARAPHGPITPIVISGRSTDLSLSTSTTDSLLRRCAGRCTGRRRRSHLCRGRPPAASRTHNLGPHTSEPRSRRSPPPGTGTLINPAQHSPCLIRCSIPHAAPWRVCRVCSCTAPPAPAPRSPLCRAACCTRCVYGGSWLGPSYALAAARFLR